MLPLTSKVNLCVTFMLFLLSFLPQSEDVNLVDPIRVHSIGVPVVDMLDVGKLLEYVLDDDGKAVQGMYGKYLRHPFSGVSLAESCDVPPEVCHIIATHAGEGNMVKRSTEAYVVHHADFMTFLPFKERLS